MIIEPPQPNAFFREQALANLCFLFGPRVDILTCLVARKTKTYPEFLDPAAVAIAYTTRGDGSRVKIMQATSYYGEVKGALQVLHSLSSKRLAAEFAQSGHDVPIENIDSCETILPPASYSLGTPDLTESGGPASLSNQCMLPLDTPLADQKSIAEIEKPEKGKGTNVADSQWESTDLIGIENQLTNSAPQTTTLLPAKQKEYSVLIDIEHPYYPSIGAFKHIECGSRECLLQAVSEIMTAHERPITRNIVIKSLSIRKGDGAYDILDYIHDDVGDLLDAVVESEKFPRIKCVYGL
ncbi:hypothetical protein Plec18170_000850 [Paecilomyces lecythidis]